MSLLNDALRKKQPNQQPTESHANTARLASGRKQQRKTLWLTGLGVVVVLVIAFSVWLWRSTPNAKAPVKRTETVVATPVEAQPTTVVAASIPKEPAPQVAQPPVVKVIKEKSLEKTRQPEKIRSPANKPKKKKPNRSKRKKEPQRVSKSTPVRSNTPISRERMKHVARLFDKARIYHRQNRINEAIVLYQEVLKIDPNHFEARFNLASAYIQTREFLNAHRIVADLYRKDPSNQQVLLNLAITQIGCGRPGQALELLDKATDQPDAPLFEIYFHKGIAHRHLGQMQAAITWYKKAENLKPNDTRLLFNFAMALDEQQHYSEAIRYYLEYIKQTPNIDVLEKKKIQQRIRQLRTYLVNSR